MEKSSLGNILDTGVSRRAVFFGSAAILAVNTERTTAQTASAAAILPSWNDGAAKQAILDFVSAVTTSSSKNYIAPEDRIATFDQDGTLWAEHPIYAQAFFALYRVHVLAPQNMNWKNQEPFSSVLSGNPEALGKLTEKDWFEIVEATHTGMSPETFYGLVAQWLAVAKHPGFKRHFLELVYQPMREVLEYLRANGFKTYIVTGGGQDFVRVYAQQVYGVPPEQVIGSVGGLKYQYSGGVAELVKAPGLVLNDNFEGKVFGIYRTIGKRPCAAFGNSSGDQEMLEWTGAGTGARLNMLVHHDDAVREYAYGPAGGLPDTKVGTFPDALLTQAQTKNWSVISMKSDWNKIFAFE